MVLACVVGMILSLIFYVCEKFHLTNDEEPAPEASEKPEAPEEVGGRQGPEPTRYGDWEKNGICSDF